MPSNLTPATRLRLPHPPPCMNKTRHPRDFPTSFARVVCVRGFSRASSTPSTNLLTCYSVIPRLSIQRISRSARRALPLTKTASESDGTRCIVLRMHQALTSVLFFQSAVSRSLSRIFRILAQRDILAAGSTCACAPAISDKTEVNAKLGARSER